jgi:myosin heavy subunit
MPPLRDRPLSFFSYHEHGSAGQPPHTYAIADNAYRNLVRDWKVR